MLEYLNFLEVFAENDGEGNDNGGKGADKNFPHASGDEPQWHNGGTQI